MKPLPPLRPTLADRVGEYFAPVHGARRLRARAQIATAASVWNSGATDRRPTKRWLPGLGSANADNLGDAPLTRARSRDLSRNNGIGAGAINTAVTSIVGTGLVLQARPDAQLLGWPDAKVREWRQLVQREFRAWCEDPAACDATATLDWFGLQALWLRSELESGDVFATLPWVERRASPYGLKLQLIEADRCVNKNQARDTDRLAGGVEVDEYGAPVAYHFLRRHPGDLLSMAGMEWDVIPAFGRQTGRRNVLHGFHKLRPGQSRGVPFLAPIIETIKAIGDYKDSELQAAVVSSFFTVFVKSNSGQGLNLGDDGAPQSGTAGSSDEIGMGPAAIIDLGKDEDVSFANPGRPNAAADIFLTAMIREIGMTLEIPYEVLVKHFQASYSAARASINEAWRAFRARRARVAAQFCQPAYETWLEEAVSRGRIDAPGFFDDPMLRRAYAGAEWIGDGPGSIDPVKDVTAADLRIKARLSNYTIEALELTGRDWEDTHEQLAREIEAQIEAGTYLPSAPGQGQGAPLARPAGPAADPGEDEDEDQADPRTSPQDGNGDPQES